MIKRQLSPEPSHTSFMNRFIEKEDTAVEDPQALNRDNNIDNPLSQEAQPGNKPLDNNAPPVDEPINVGDKAATEVPDEGFDALFGRTNEATGDKDKQQSLELQGKAKNYDDIKPLLDDPLVEMAIAFKKAGKRNYKEFIEHLAGPDINNDNPEDVYAYFLKNIKHIKDETVFDTHMRMFSELPEEAQRDEVNNITAALFDARQEKLKGYSLDLRSEQKMREDHQKEGNKQLIDHSKKMVGLNIKGFVITPEIDAEVRKGIQTEFAYYDTSSSSGYDINKSYLMHLIDKFGYNMFNLIEKNAFEKGAASIADRVVNASANTSPKTAQNAKGITDAAEDKQQIDDYLSRQRARAK